ncbi:MAG: hypothetical protein NT126_09275 [Bacteroidetes bacterium]|nr:hypothetical protein [Bacteroidota bacterium]
MKKNRNIFFTTMVLALVAVFLIYRTRNGTIRPELHDFAVADTGSVTKIFLANKNGGMVTLERKSDFQWSVNGKYQARPDAIKMLLTTIKSLSVKTRVAKAGYNGVIRDIAASGIKCEIYQNGESKPMKVYYVGGSTADVLGTFMLIENSGLPFVIEIPGFQGYLTPRYSPFEKDWRSMTVFDYAIDEIKNITVHYYHDPEKSFSIDQSGRQFRVVSPETKKIIQHPDTVGLINYFSFFRNLCFETWDVEYTDRQRDSLKTTIPVNTISVTTNGGMTKSITTYPKPVTLRSLAQADSSGKPLKYDIDRLYAFINDGSEFVVIQYYVFGKIFRQLDDFNADRRKK